MIHWVVDRVALEVKPAVVQGQIIAQEGLARRLRPRDPHQPAGCGSSTSRGTAGSAPAPAGSAVTLLALLTALLPPGLCQRWPKRRWLRRPLRAQRELRDRDIRHQRVEGQGTNAAARAVVCVHSCRTATDSGNFF